MRLENPPTLTSELMSLPVTSWKRFARELHEGRIEQICILSDVERMTCEAEEQNQLVSEGADALSAKSKKERFDEQGWDSLKARPFYKVLREYKDVLPDDIPAELPQDKGIQHEIDLVPGTKYCVTRQWPLPRDAIRITERDINGYTSMCVPDDLKTLRASFQAQASSSAADNRSTYPSAVGDYSARPSFTPFGGGGGGGLREEILSDEYENEPNPRSGSNDQQFAGRSSELTRVRLATGVGAAGRRPGFGQPNLESRLEAVERLQASQFAALRQDLSLLNAQLADVAQTTSNVKVEVGTKLSSALKRVAALESALASHQT
uniref:Reverse transcriptase n=1 Tax=Phytophthora ramorum TaxID=164328 RepID=H3GTB0_PHYRM